MSSSEFFKKVRRKFDKQRELALSGGTNDNEAERHLPTVRPWNVPDVVQRLLLWEDTMTKLKELEPVVKEILKQKPATRGDDDLLYIYVLDQMHINLSSYSVTSFLLNYRKLGVPTIESVGRCRGKIQSKHEELKPTPDIILKRKKVENSFYDYSLGYKETC